MECEDSFAASVQITLLVLVVFVPPLFLSGLRSVYSTDLKGPQFFGRQAPSLYTDLWEKNAFCDNKGM